MALSANAYGSLTGVGALVPSLANANGTFDSSTQPLIGQVEGWIEETSALLNMILKFNGFDAPVTEAQVVLVLDMFINNEVSDIVKAHNNTGRLAVEFEDRPTPNIYMTISKDVTDFVEKLAAAFARSGAARPRTEITDVDYLGTDDSGNAIGALFSFEDFGNA